MTKRRDFFTAAAWLTPMEAAGAKLPDVTLSAAQARLTKESFGDLRIYFEGATDQLKSVTAGSLKLNPGASPHPPHEHEEEEFMIVTEGAGEISIEGKTVKAGPGAMMYCAAGKPHGIVNTGKAPLTFYFYKWKA